MSNIINIAIIAHVDHGKTTLIDSLLSQTGQFRENQNVEIRAMDSNALEKERGITILAKCTAIHWKDHLINIVDTPGHADFGGEVERILGMVDGVIVLVDAAEGPLPQTKFVLSKALKLNLKPIVVVNKVDRSDARIQEVLDEMFELFMHLNATDEQLHYPILYASGRNGWASKELNVKTENLHPLLDQIIETIPKVQQKNDEKFKMLSVILEVDSYLGTLLTGKVESGVVYPNMNVKVLDLNGNIVESGRITKLLTFDGLKRINAEKVESGNICIIAGLKKATVTNTICDPEVTEPIKSYEIDPPTISIFVSVNDSPFAGTEGKKCTSRMIGERLAQEAEKNIALRITQSENNDQFEVAGRGELQLGILIETMRREGFELTISKPKVIMKKEDGKLLEPIEEVIIDVDEEYSGIVVEKMSQRKGIMQDMRLSSNLGQKSRMIFHIPTRGLIGYHSEFLTDTRGTGMMNRIFKGYEEFRGAIVSRINGSLISMATGQATAFSIFALQDRGVMFIKPGEKVYEGMIVGQNSKDNDLEINVIKAKQLTNIRAAGKDDAIKCANPKIFTLEEAISYIEDDELIEVTPENIRMRKKYLSATERKKAGR